jgi:hypothetical protein
VPFSHELRKYARERLASDDRDPTEEDILDELFARWDRGEVLNQREHRMALRARERGLYVPAKTDDARSVSDAKAADFASAGTLRREPNRSAWTDEAEMSEQDTGNELSSIGDFPWGALEVLQ